MELKNPCLECDHHLAGGDKNGPRCMACQSRVDYVSNIGCLGASLESNVHLVGNGGFNMTEKQPNADLSGIDVEYTIVMDICEKYGIDVGRLRNHKRGSNYSMARKEIAKKLMKEKPGMTHAAIGKMIGVHSSRVGQFVMEEKKDKKPPKKIKAESSKIGIEDLKPELPAGEPGPDPGHAGQKLVLDFSNYPQIYDDLLAMADDEIRTPENQALYILKLIHEKGLDALKVDKELQISQP